MFGGTMDNFCRRLLSSVDVGSKACTASSLTYCKHHNPCSIKGLLIQIALWGLNLNEFHVKNKTILTFPDPVKSKGKTVLPILIVHGWPGSVVEFVKLIPMLTTPR
jgi:hypothetical protein